MIVDAHVHIGKTDRVDCPMDLVLREADRLGIERVCCMHMASLKYAMREGNDALGAAMRLHPDRILGYASVISPRFAGEAVDEVRRCAEVHGVQGVKIYSRSALPAGRDPLISVAESDMFPIVEAAASLGLPVLAHAHPAECELLASRVPEVIMIIAHAGGTSVAWGDWHRAIAAAERYPNIYLETSSSCVDMGQVELAVERLGPERVIYGSDMLFLNPVVQLARITGAEIDDASKEQILGKNILRLFGMDRE